MTSDMADCKNLNRKFLAKKQADWQRKNLEEKKKAEETGCKSLRLKQQAENVQWHLLRFIPHLNILRVALYSLK